MSTETAKKDLLDWLRNAHAMERQAETMLKGQSERIDHYPMLKNRITKHIDETRDQTNKIEACIKQLGGTTSSLKDLGGKIAAFGQAMGGMIVGDEVVKGGAASYAFEHFEIATYRTLIAAAEEANEPDVKAVCEEILAEEEAMAKWLIDNLPDVTREYVKRHASPDETAKR